MKTVVTHSGPFHADDVAAIAILKMIYDIEVVRTRDPKVIKKADIVVDVGGVYDMATNRFDHHQLDYTGSREGVPYASAGLVWNKFGDLLVSCKSCKDVIDTKLMQNIDANDVGLDGYDCGISEAISGFNPNWNENANFDDCFLQAVEFFTVILKNLIKSIEAELEAKKEIISVGVGNILVLNKWLPWKKTVVNDLPNILLVVSPDQVNGWTLQVAPVDMDSFDSRIMLPKNWAGLRDKELNIVTGVYDCVFCHKGLFICGNKTFFGIMSMARKALEFHKESKLRR